MKTKLFFEGDLPEVLSEEETIKYFRDFQNGNLEVRKILVEHNIRLVINQVVNKFYNSGFELEDLIQVGTIGLINAVNTYDLEKNVKFHTYACKCIYNEVILFLRKNNKHANIKSLNETVSETDNGIEVPMLEKLVDEKVNISDEYIRFEMIDEIKKHVEVLQDRDKEIVMMYFGFYNKSYSQEQIAKHFGISRQYISVVIKRILLKLKKDLIRDGIIEEGLKY